jgi:hydrogenase nickel incorporation protein HypB
VRIPVLVDILEANNLIAAEIREGLAGENILALNLMASPGAGKTALIERTIEALGGEMRVAVIEGDVATTLDSERIARHEVPVVQINTGGICHLEARMIKSALQSLDLSRVDLLFMENVGNLICPTGFDLGEDAKVVMVSLPEGEDKPLKYPNLFREAKALVINKIDLGPYLKAQASAIEEAARSINLSLEVFPLSCETGEGLKPWHDWICSLWAAKQHRR